MTCTHTCPPVLLRALLTLGATLIFSAQAPAQDDAQGLTLLFDELAVMDSLLFDAAFVECDADRFAAMFTDDAEFYHDVAGPSFGQAARTLNGCPRSNGVRRILVPGSLEVYPMEGYGAIQMGSHRFVEEGVESATIARFVHLWRNEDGVWRLARVLSFDHRPHTP